MARGALADTRPLRTPAYRRLWTAGVVTVVGAQLTVVAVPTQIFALTGSSAYVGLTGLFGLVPLVVFGLWGGAIADAVDRRTLLLVTGAGIAAMSLALWVIAASGVGNVWVVLVLFAVQTALLAINQPTRSAVIPRLVEPALLPAANTLNFTVFHARRVRRAAAGGRADPGDRAAHALPARRHRAARHAVGHVAAARDAARGRAAGPGGARARWSPGSGTPRCTRCCSSRSSSTSSRWRSACRGSCSPRWPSGRSATRPAAASRWACCSPRSPSGAVVGGLFSGCLTRIRRQGVAVLVSICVWGLGVALFGLTSTLWLAVLLLAIAGAGDLVSAVFRSSMLQTVATDEMRGRMQGVFTVVVAGGPAGGRPLARRGGRRRRARAWPLRRAVSP